MLKVFIADDSKIIRDHQVEMLSDFPEIEIVGQAQDAFEAIVNISRLKPDVIILDINMPGSGISVLEKVRNNGIPSVVIILTNYPFPQYRERCLGLGANFFFDKSTEFEKVSEVFEQLIRENGPDM